MLRLTLLQYKQELAWCGAEYWYYVFEEDLNAFKVAFAKNHSLLRPGKAIEEIDRAHPPYGRNQEVPDNLKPLRLANNNWTMSLSKTDTQKLTMKAKLEALKGEWENGLNNLLDTINQICWDDRMLERQGQEGKETFYQQW